jgi:hypothetical protein
LKREAEEMVADVFRGEIVRAESESPPVIYNKRLPIHFLIMINQCCILAPRKAQTTSNWIGFLWERYWANRQV